MMAGCCMGRSAATQQLPAWLAGMQAAAGGAPTGVRLVLTAHTGNNLQCVRERGGHAQCANKNKGAWEILQLKQLGSGRGHYVLASLHNGCNLQCRPDGAVSFANKNELQWEQWTIERQGDKWFFVSVHTGKVLQCDGRGQLRCANQNRKEWEAFSLVVVDGGGRGAVATTLQAAAGGAPTSPSNGKVFDISGQMTLLGQDYRSVSAAGAV